MAEAVAVAGLVASIIALVDLGAKIVSSVNEFASLSTEVPKSLHSLFDRLPLLIQTLETIQARAQAGDVSGAAAQDLKTLVDSLQTQIEVLGECLREIVPHNGASRLTKSRKALRSLWKNNAMMQAVDKIHQGIDVLILHQTTTNIDLSNHILQEIADLKVKEVPARQEFGLCLHQAPHVDPSAFLGRETELQQLNDWLYPDGLTARKLVSIVGMGGLGKTQLALAYARQHGAGFSSVFWLNARDKLSLQQSLSGLYHMIFEHEETTMNNSTEDDARLMQSVLTWLSEPWNSRWLLIFDNYDDPALVNLPSPTGFDIQQFFPYRTHGSILITTRSPKLTFSKSLMLQKLDLNIGLAVLLQRAGRGMNNDSDVNAEANRLATRLNGLPLALVSAGSYIGQTGTSFAAYHNLYEKLWSELNSAENGMLLEYDRTLSSTWTISLDHVNRQSSDATELLKLFALFNGDDIWYDLIAAGASSAPKWLQRVSATEIHFNQAIMKLRDYSLLEVRPGSYRIHPCVQDWLIDRYQLLSDESWFKVVLRCITRCIGEDTDDQYWRLCRRLIQHIQRISSQRFQCLWNSRVAKRGTIRAAYRFASLYEDTCLFAEAELMYERALEGSEEAFGTKHMSTLEKLNALGHLYIRQGKYTQAEGIYGRALVVTEALGPEHRATLATDDNLGWLYFKQGRLKEAEQVLERTLAGLEQVVGREHVATLQVVSRLGDLYHVRGKSAEAEEAYLRAIAGREDIFGPEHVATLAVINNLGTLYFNQGKLEKLEELYKRVLFGYEKAHGMEHTSTLHTFTNLGVLYEQQSRLSEAEEMYKQAITGYEKTFGPEHATTLMTIDNLAFLYFRQGKAAVAEELFERALAGLEKTLGPEHASTLATVANLGLLHSEQGNFEKAELLQTRALAGCMKAFGPDHRLTLRAFNNIGLLYYRQGKLVEAEEMYERVLAGQMKLYGPEHMHTFSIMNNIGALYYMQGKLEESEQMMCRALVGKEKYYGAEHTSTLTAMFNLGLSYEDHGKIKEAEEMFERALIGFEKTLGLEHALTQQTTSRLNALRTERR